MRTSVALIGFMGTGKTAAGKALADRLGKAFIEMDALIEQRAGKTIPRIFQQDGEIAFRQLEIEVTKEIATRKNTVIACGGGVVLNKINIDRLSQECVIVYLTASPGVILRRTSTDKNNRPLLSTPDRAGQIRQLIKFRNPFYERSAGIKIDTSKLDIAAVVEQIINGLKQDEGFSF